MTAATEPMVGDHGPFASGVRYEFRVWGRQRRARRRLARMGEVVRDHVVTDCYLLGDDADWNVTANPMMADWPRVLLTTVTFEEDGAKTKMRLTWVPHEASEAEIACFAAAMDGRILAEVGAFAIAPFADGEQGAWLVL